MSVTRTTLLALYVILAAVLVAYFVVMNDSTFILCSFIGFIVLGFALPFRPKHVGLVLQLSLVLIVSSALVYINLPIYMAEYGIAALLVAIAATFLLPSRGRWAVILTLLLTFTLYALGLQQSGYLSVNIAIIGYYMLISVAIALFLGELGIRHSGLRRSAKRTARTIAHSLNAMGIRPAYLGILAAILLLALPIWPSGVYVTSSPVNATIHLNISAQDGANTLLLDLHSAAYIYLENHNLSNLRFFYQNGTPMTAYASYDSNHPYSAPVLLRVNGPVNTIKVSFMPMATQFNSTMIGVNASEFKAMSAHATGVQYSPGNPVVPAGVALTSANVIFESNVWVSSGHTGNVTAYPPYTLQNICTPGTDTKATLSVSSDLPASVFMMGSMGDFSDAVKSSARGATPGGYIKSFLADSYAYELNESRSTFTITVENGSCAPYVIVPSGQTDIVIRTNMTYALQIQENSAGQLPTAVFAVRHWFLPYGLTYLYDMYNNVTWLRDYTLYNESR